MAARYRCWLCQVRVWTIVPSPAGASPQRQERIAMAALSDHVIREHRGAR